MHKVEGNVTPNPSRRRTMKLRTITSRGGKHVRTGLLFALVLPLLTCLFTSLPVKASDTAIWVAPQWNYYGVGENFTVEVKLADAQHLFAWQIALSFNASVLNVLNVVYASDHVFNGHEVVTVNPVINNVEGYILHGASLLGNDEVSGSGGLDQITFAVVGHGQSILKIDREGDGSIAGNFGTFLLDPSLNTISFALADGYHHNHLLGDVTGLNGKPDATVNMRDISYLVTQFDTTPQSSKWDPIADLNGDGKVDMKDISITISNFGHHWP
jgi:hypothetical protein